LKKTLAIGQKKLSRFYKKDESGRWEFIGILPILAHHREFETTYFKFYQEYFSQIVPQGYRVLFKAGVMLLSHIVIASAARQL
jgi:hypothetical protein